MTRLALHAVLVATLAMSGCSSGPRFQAALPQVRDVPVVANLAPHEALARGRSFLGARQYGLAIELFRNAGRDPALRTDSLNGLAVAYDAIGRRDIAERYFEEALASQPDDARTRRNLARFYAATGQMDKQRAILSATVAIAAPAGSASKGNEGMAEIVHDTATPRAMAIGQQTPLSAFLPPMIVRAALPPQGASASPATTTNGRTGDVVECLLDRPVGAAAVSAEMRMFRLNIGEVFIAAEPPGTLCRNAPTGADGQPESGTSNGEYLGRVAAYLDRLNRQAAAEEFAALWRATFWSYRGA
ncbi:tetratricopeptide repeat protein [Sphingopyxis alaskensis]|uniref:Tetratricopeptide TPR_2 n=1 Tax=Sphingopyxis alaskensis (strain DSM 13593 / LMG 18877 / RB2256) TaxID=317655 RepID=Q1GPF3_SPHAL|nr:tetratricopeptide repeat protein [Sphingopyxis alaskensis]ABF54469.1 Tetratricopeptide TPR_2 [Sphingopyxis alaskensis RB2256]MCM3417808.1 hypothetical protein [Sphingopyxis alaskensis]